MAFEGMDVDQVQNLAGQLHTQAENITSTMNFIDGLISQLEQSWTGADAREFQGWWTSQHKPALKNAADAIEGLSQSARNNAGQQTDASRI